MFSRRIANAHPFRSATPSVRAVRAVRAFGHSSWGENTDAPGRPAPAQWPRLTDVEDPNMNGGYINPPRVKRQFRDPHADWWDKQERRNYGEPVHEDNDILGMFSPEEYTWVKPAKGAFQVGCFIAAVFGLCGVVSLMYPDLPAVPREFEGGLEAELGGSNAVRARMAGDP